MSIGKHEAQLSGKYTVGRYNGDDYTFFHRLLRKWKEKQTKTKMETKHCHPLALLQGLM